MITGLKVDEWHNSVDQIVQNYSQKSRKVFEVQVIREPKGDQSRYEPRVDHNYLDVEVDEEHDYHYYQVIVDQRMQDLWFGGDQVVHLFGHNQDQVVEQVSHMSVHIWMGVDSVGADRTSKPVI